MRRSAPSPGWTPGGDHGSSSLECRVGESGAACVVVGLRGDVDVTALPALLSRREQLTAGGVPVVVIRSVLGAAVGTIVRLDRPGVGPAGHGSGVLAARGPVSGVGGAAA